MKFSTHKAVVSLIAGGALLLVWIIWRHFNEFKAAGTERQNELDGLLNANG